MLTNLCIIQQALYEYAFSVWGEETFIITHSIPRGTMIQPNCTLREAGIVRDTMLILETTENKTVDFTRLHVSRISNCNLCMFAQLSECVAIGTVA